MKTTLATSLAAMLVVASLAGCDRGTPPAPASGSATPATPPASAASR